MSAQPPKAPILAEVGDMVRVEDREGWWPVWSSLSNEGRVMIEEAPGTVYGPCVVVERRRTTVSACAQCGVVLEPQTDTEPRADMRWCGDACVQAWDDAHPGYWIKVADMTPEQRAELDGILGKAGKA